MVSAARYVEDVDADPVVLFDGLTKNWRYPGWRTHLDRRPASGDRGGLEQRLVPRRRRQQAAPALRRAAARPVGGLRGDGGDPTTRFFASGRSWATGSARPGVRFDLEPEGTFYWWGDVSALPPSINTGMTFFQRAPRAPGDLRAGRVLRRESRQAPERAAVAVPELRAVLVRAGGAGGGGGGEED